MVVIRLCALPPSRNVGQLTVAGYCHLTPSRITHYTGPNYWPEKSRLLFCLMNVGFVVRC